jgi:hypothetical protein
LVVCVVRDSVAHQKAVVCHNDKLMIPLPLMVNYCLLLMLAVVGTIKIHSVDYRLSAFPSRDLIAFQVSVLHDSYNSIDLFVILNIETMDG